MKKRLFVASALGCFAGLGLILGALQAPAMEAGPPPIADLEAFLAAGGATAAEKAPLEDRHVPAKGINPQLRQSSLDCSVRQVSGGGRMTKTFQEPPRTRRSARGPDLKREATAKPLGGYDRKEVERARWLWENLGEEKSERKLKLEMEDQWAAPLGPRPTFSGLGLGLRARELAIGQSIMREAAIHADQLEGLALQKEVAAAVAAADGSFLVRLRGSSSWMKATAWSTDIKAGVPIYDLAFVDRAAALKAFDGGEAVAIPVRQPAGSGLPIRVEARGPPPDAPLVPMELEWNGRVLRGRLDPRSGHLHLGKGELPAELLDDPARFLRLLRRSGLADVKADPDHTGAARLAGEMVADPAGFARRARARFDASLRDCDELIGAGDDHAALQTLARLEDDYGPQPEVRLRQAVAEIGSGRPGPGAELAKGAIGSKRSHDAKLFEEIDARIAAPGLDATARENLWAVRRAAAWGDEAPGRVALTSERGKVNLDYHAAGPLAFGEAVPEARVLEADAPVYIADSSGLTSLDLSPSFDESLRGLVQGGTYKVAALRNEPIARLRPNRIFVGDAPAPALVEARPSGLSEKVARAYPPNPGPLNGDGDDDDDEKEKELKRFLAGPTKPEVFAIVPVGGGR